MSGSKIGGLKTAQTNKERRGADYHREIGRIGGSRTNTKPKGFAYAKLNLSQDDPAHPANAGFKGGKISKRSKK